MEAQTRIRQVADRLIAAGETGSRAARDPVNFPTIENWLEAIGDGNPVYTDPDFAAGSVHGALVAPPAMIQVWTMNPGAAKGQARGVSPLADTDPAGEMIRVLDAAGYTSVVATNCDQVYHRYLRHGEQLTLRIGLTGLTGPKRTALGEGWFFTTRNTWYSGGEQVATMDFRMLKFRPPEPGQETRKPAPQSGAVMRPAISPDTAFFWTGTTARELRIQRCTECGALRHPPGPMCLVCGSPEPDYVIAAGTGRVFSYIVHHHPPVPGKRLPMVLALTELTEGVRVLGELVGADPAEVKVGMPVRAAFSKIDDELTLPAWRPVRLTGAWALPDELPELTIDVSTTFVVGSALATRDFTRVHHDRDFAVASGSKDIFVNILTTTGLVQRFVSSWAGPEAILRSISVRLGAPCYAGDTLTFSGHVTGYDSASRRCEVSVTGKCGLGDHVTAAVAVDLPGLAGGRP
ncbi:MAG TPA: OB-fold domain-containing protein [Streptosporangiaceae bacterium]|nr:OB-fold domain-containing protein [Streptosporangiaceae bacterium]